jgi:antitoxin (DNA-binding transcriptional repressor) of toxin-antitoxin stability system
MPVVGLRQLSRETREVITQLEVDGEPVVITRQGQPIAALTAISQEDVASFALALAPELVAGRERAAAAIAAGEGEPASQVLAEFEAEERHEHSEEADDEVEAAYDLEMPTIPRSAVERVAEFAAAGVVGTGLAAAPIQTLNMELIQTLLAESWTSIVERVRTVNENIVAHAGGDPKAVSIETYAKELELVTTAERLSSRSAAVSEASPVSSE